MQSVGIPSKPASIQTLSDRLAPRRTDLLLIIALAVMLRVLFCFVVYPAVADRFRSNDGYDVIALNLTRGNGYVMDGQPAAAERLPVYPVLLAISFWLFGPSSWPWQLAQCACGAVTCGLVLSLARQYASRAGALVAAGFCAIHPTLILYTARPLTETLYIWLLLLLVREMSSPAWRPPVVGPLLGLQLLIKSTALLHVVAFIPTLFRRRFGTVVRSGVGVLLVLFPWILWNLSTYGQPHLLSARGGITMYHGIYISRHVTWTQPAGDFNQEAELELWQDLERHGVSHNADVVRRDQLAGQLVRAWISSHRREAIQLWARNLVLTWYLGRSRLSMLVHFILHSVLLIAAAVGAVRIWLVRRDARALVTIAALLIVAYTVVHAVIQPAVRYILPAVPLAALLAAGVGVTTRRSG